MDFASQGNPDFGRSAGAEGYSSKQACLNGLNLVKKQSGTAPVFDYEDKKWIQRRPASATAATVSRDRAAPEAGDRLGRGGEIELATTCAPCRSGSCRIPLSRQANPMRADKSRRLHYCPER